MKLLHGRVGTPTKTKVEHNAHRLDMVQGFQIARTENSPLNSVKTAHRKSMIWTSSSLRMEAGNSKSMRMSL